MNKYEQLVEFIINDETDKARELFHDIVVEKSRDIYESLVSEEDLDNVEETEEVSDLVDEVGLEEEGISEEEDEEGEEVDVDADMEMDAEEAPEEEHEEIEDRVEDLEDALDELKAEFDALMAGEAEEPEHADMEMPEMPEEMHMEESEEIDEADVEEEEIDEEVVREYVEKVATPANTEGADNKSSVVAGKNDMGGTAVDVTAGGASNPDGNSPKATEKPKAHTPHAGSYENVPGAKAGKTFAKKETAVKKEEPAVNKTSVEAGK